MHRNNGCPEVVKYVVQAHAWMAASSPQAIIKRWLMELLSGSQRTSRSGGKIGYRPGKDWERFL